MLFDYIIVGAGSAGCVLAERLSADPTRSVCLIEAGGEAGGWLMTMPRGVARLLGDSRYLWRYEAGRGQGQGTETWLKGRGIGGSSSINGMLYVRGHPADFDGWEAAGCPGWSSRDIERVYAEMEDHELGPGDAGQRGVGGPLMVTMHPGGDPFCEAFLDAAAQAGIARVADINAAPGGGIGYQPRTVWRGRRQSAAVAFLDPARARPNLHVLTNTQAVRLTIERGRATGVLVRDARGEQILRASRDIILAAGAIETPKLLQLSGVGPSACLEAAGVALVQDLPGVGQNLQEQLFLPVQYRVARGSLNRQFAGWRLYLNVLRYLMRRTGPMARAAVEMMAMVKSDPALARPDIQLGIALYTMDVNKLGAIGSDPGITFGTCLMQPTSRGALRITAADPDAPLQIDANYLDSAKDRAAPAQIVRAIRRIMQQPALAAYSPIEILPGREMASDDDLLSFAKRFGSSAYHVSGTCRMGSDADAVVDPELRVRGIAGLRVADTSIMPTIVSGNTQAAAMAIGWRAAEIIASDQTS